MLSSKIFHVRLNLRYVNIVTGLSTSQVRSQTNAATQVSQKEWQEARPFKDIPNESALRYIRNFLPGGEYRNLNYADTLYKFHEKYGDICLIPSLFGRSPILLTFNPADFETIFRNDGSWPNRPGLEILLYHREKHRPTFYQGANGLLPSNGEKWVKFRSAVNPVLMQPRNAKFYISKMCKISSEFVERIKQIRDPKSLEVPANFEDEIKRWILESILVVALNKQLGLIRNNSDDPVAKKYFDIISEILILAGEFEIQPPIWKIISTPKFKRVMQLLDELQDITLNYIEETLVRLQEDRKNGTIRNEAEKSILEKLFSIDKRIAMVLIVDMLLAGVDTTTTTFTGIMLCLAKNPEKQQKLREELFRIMPQKDTPFTEDIRKELNYTRCCIKEALRVYPLGPGNTRVLQNDVVLSGYQVPKGILVVMMAESLLKNETHFPRANEFMPERWRRGIKQDSTECPGSMKSTNPFIYLPFGYGPRVCIGKRIAELELELGVARIIRNFKVEFNHSTENAFKPLIFNMPNIPLKFKFIDL
ncbi:cytochrome P450 CYP12A2-like isoform X2 [Teleopsis dalmanni]|uniref:cytochrome P450 CYP12A2-like isoform X2 n=1 Tax=Teleopsis dalmanni TaxID=139649 RepID=UPI0018CEEEEE|nr:cytochrome P450 CYP12A2-like isoform X2 [Teleopsis dalmanni]